MGHSSLRLLCPIRHMSFVIRRFLPVVCLLATAPASAIAADDADLILHHGKVVTVDDKFTVAEALAIGGERILAVGSNAEVLKLASPTTRQIDLAGKTIIPGLIDSHVHPGAASMYEFDHPIPEMDTIADVLHYIQSRAEVLEPGQWIAVHQVFITRLRDQRYPTRKELDQVAPRHPVLFATGPDASLKTLALTISGIDRDTKITDGGPGHIEHDPATGEPTGILRSCTRLVKDRLSERLPSMDQQRAGLKSLLADYNSVGITSVTDRDASDDVVQLYEQLRGAGKLSCRVFVHGSVNAQDSLEAIEKRIHQLADSPHHKYDNRLWQRGIKVYLDGGMLTGSAYMRQPWGVSRIYSITDPEYRGLLFIPPEKLKSIVGLAIANELQPTAHSVGDGAVHALIDAYRAINSDLKAAGDQDVPIRRYRPCITHCNFLTAEAIAAMKSLGIVADLQPDWLWLDGKTLLRQFGEERLKYFQPYRTLFEEGVVVGGGSDHMQKVGSRRSVNPYNPFLGMWITLARLPKGSSAALHSAQALSREQALRLYTVNNAWLTFEEREKGSLEAGKLADFVILKQDLLTCPVEEIPAIEVDRTYLGGEVVYAAP